MKSMGRSLPTSRLVVILAFLSLAPRALAQSAPPAQTAPIAASAMPKLPSAPSAINLPLFFEANKGQTAPRVRFLTRSSGYTLFLTSTETVLAETKTQIGPDSKNFGELREFKSSPGAVVRMQLVGANSEPATAGLEELPGKVNYLIGNDRSQWHSEVPLFSKVRAEQVYPGVDLLFHGDQNQLEYDFMVAPGADPSKIKFRIRGADRVEIDSRGDLVLHTPTSNFRMHRPLIYQTFSSERRRIEGSFVKKGKNEVAFKVGAYDRSQPLVIDPEISFATFLGSNGIEQSFGIAVDDTTPSSPKLYVAGFTSDSTTFPESSFVPSVVTTIGSATSTTAPIVTLDGFVAKIDPTKTGPASLIYLTFVGGKKPAISTNPGCFSGFIWLALDKSQGASAVQPVVGGQTTCSDFPHTVVLNPVTATTGQGDSAVAMRLTLDGSNMDKSALLGGNDVVNGGFVSVDSAGNILLSGDTQANNLPKMNAYISNFNNGVTPAPFNDCFVSRLNRSDLSLNYLTYLNVGGGSTSTKNAGCGAFEDSSGNILAGGNTFSATAFNLGAGGASLANGFQPTFQGTEDTFVLKLNPTLSGLNQFVYASFFGGGGTTIAGNGSFDLGNGVVALVGATTSASTGPNAPDIPLANAFQSSNAAAGSTNGQIGFVFVLDTTKTGLSSLLCSTYLGGSTGNDFIHGVTYDAADPTSFRIIVGGETGGSLGFATPNSLQPFVGTLDGFVAVLKVPQPGQSFNASLYFYTFIGSGMTTTAGGKTVDTERIEGLAVDSNHTIYASGYALSSNFFANTNLPTPNGFQTTCTSCNLTPPLDDLVLFTLTSGPGATITSITVTPASPSIPAGTTQQFTAQGFFSDGTIQDLTTTATWSSTITSVATISNAAGSQGLATGVSAGQSSITASLNGVTSPGVTLTVTGAANPPALLILKSHTGNFTQGQQGAIYIVTVSNGANAGPTSGTVTVTDTLPSGLTLVSMVGVGWTCGTPNANNVCTRADAVAGAASYPPITVTVNVAANATSPQVNAVGVSGGGSPAANAVDSTTITGGTITPTLSIAKSHVGNFAQGQQAATYTVTVSNAANASSTTGGVTVNDTIPSGLTFVSMSGTGWTCNGPSCSRKDVLAAGASYPAITVIVNVAANATSPQVNSVSVSGGGSVTANASDSTVIAGPASLTITKSHSADFTLGQQGAQYTVTVSDAANAGPTSGTVTVTDTLPSGLSIVSMAGSGWNCASTACTRSDALAGGASYPAITVTVNVTAPAATTVVNMVTVTGGGSASSTASDSTNITAVPFTLTIVPPAGGSPGVPLGVSPGGQVAVGLLLTPIPGFSGTVTFSCTSSAPQFITCNPTPSQVKLSPNGTQVAVVVNTFCKGDMPLNGPLDGPSNGPMNGPATLGIELLLAALAISGVIWSHRRRSPWAFSFAVLLLIALGSAACGSLPKGSAGPTPAGNYTLFITATANGQSATVQQQIQVQ